MASKDENTLTFPVAGMTCGACAHSVEAALAKVPGVRSVRVNYGSRIAVVERDPEVATGSALRAAVRRAGYSVPESLGEERSLMEDLAFAEEAEARATRRLRGELIVAALFSVAVSAIPPRALDGLALLAVAAVVQLGAGRTLLQNGWRAARRLAPDMNTLVGLGSLSAFLAGTAAVFGWSTAGSPAPLLRASAWTVTFTLIGRFLEGRARSKAGSAVRALLDLTPPTARILRRGEEIEVPLEEVRPGNLVLIRPGEQVPVDGTILSGHSELDESMLTGESRPVERGAGEAVHAGTLNGLGALSVKAERVGLDTALGRIAEAVRAAQGSRGESQRLADRISAVFVPGVLALAALTCVAWLLAGASVADALTRVVAVLVVACPCALGLATPTAIVVASGRGAREGCLFRDAPALERMARVDTAVLDKTGTLTRGEPELSHLVPLDGSDEAQLLTFAAAVERGSEQPLARAVLAAAAQRGLTVPMATGILAEPGRGIGGTVEGHEVRLLSPRAARELGLELSAAFDTLPKTVTPVLLLIGGVPAAALGFRDALRPTSADAIASLQRLGIESHVVSGDDPAVVAELAQMLGIQHHRGAVSPEEKADYVAQLSAAGRNVLMAGDGINDAVALSAADVGIAFGGGADVAIQAADGALLADDPARLPALVMLSRRTLATIRQNLLWAFSYNLVALPIAAGVLSPWTTWRLPPQWGAAAMACSSLFVVLNSLRLRRVSLAGD